MFCTCVLPYALTCLHVTHLLLCFFRRTSPARDKDDDDPTYEPDVDQDDDEDEDEYSPPKSKVKKHQPKKSIAKTLEKLYKDLPGSDADESTDDDDDDNDDGAETDSMMDVLDEEIDKLDKEEYQCHVSDEDDEDEDEDDDDRADDSRPRGMPDLTPPKKSGRKTKKIWTPKKEALLCSLWEEESHLYDSSSSKYKNKELRMKALKRFSAALDISGIKIFNIT